ncbi:hypothetical protein [Limnohabitans radicicola]|jgi:hypothetical protein|uniref:DUF4175 domain-containing protein n=1 Tax=Limnohabitans radicicola TaxID=2771427 RepID=A0A927IM17_9BURK|nr:hypothetical protein [Limnohabitans radicicola]MBD8051293.1 hypothetical protein [Limnohabitans radicicola]
MLTATIFHRKKEITTSKIRHTLVGICVASLSLGVMAQTADEHKAHHPAGSTSPASANMKAAAKPTGAGPMAAMAKMDEHMKAMQAMHEKMLAAKTPAERQALMDEHMKLMQDGMGMMQQMGAGMQGMGGMQGGKGMPANMAERQQMMEKRMQMMESTMQMMLDRLPATPAK